MRYVLASFFLFAVLVLGMAGLRFDHGGKPSRQPPIEVFPDMDRQPKLRPQTVETFFGDQASSRQFVPGTIARGTPYEETPYNTGRVPGTTNFVETLPVKVTESVLKRGQERFTIYCAVCHGALGDGKGVTAKYGMVAMANFHDKRLVEMPDGEIFNTITYGKNLMGSYGSQVPIADRWAIIAYVRALERSRLGIIDDVPEQFRSQFKK